MALAVELASRKAEVIAIDRSQTLVEQIKDQVDFALRVDATDEVALRSQQVDQVDTAVVAIGEHFESALLTTTILKNLEIPNIICRARSELHGDIFLRIGANSVIQPEIRTGEELARKLAMPHIRDLIPLEEGFTLIELVAPKRFLDKNLIELKLREEYHVNLVAIQRSLNKPDEDGIEKKVVNVPEPKDIIKEGDVLYIVGPDTALAQLPRE